MSYILDALKKSEQERGHGSVPGVQTVHSSGLNYGSDKKAYWPYILIAAVLLNFAAILYFIFEKSKSVETEIAHTQEDSTAAGTVPVTLTEKEQAAPAENNKQAAVAISASADSMTAVPEADTVTIKETATADSSQTKNSTTPVVENVRPATKDVVDFYDLPQSIQQELPAIIISAHVYSSNPQQRSIVINNNFMEEGEYVIDGLVLYEITQDGALFDYKDMRFHYGVVRSWQ